MHMSRLGQAEFGWIVSGKVSFKSAWVWCKKEGAYSLGPSHVLFCWKIFTAHVVKVGFWTVFFIRIVLLFFFMGQIKLKLKGKEREVLGEFTMSCPNGDYNCPLPPNMPRCGFDGSLCLYGNYWYSRRETCWGGRGSMVYWLRGCGLARNVDFLNGPNFPAKFDLFVGPVAQQSINQPTDIFKPERDKNLHPGKTRGSKVTEK